VTLPSEVPLPGHELASLLAAAAAGDKAAFDRVYGILYEELSVLARAQRRRWQGNDTLSTTVLVHEAYIKLAGSIGRDSPGGDDDRGARWEGRRHFFALAAQAMRQVLVNYAEGQLSAKRGGGAERVPLDLVGDEAPAPGSAEDILALNEALQRLEARDPRQARIVECRFFAGLSIPETAEVLDISPATVKREWQAASAWLYQELARPE
jgi:RNA polymerase sigma factor (TIGR02999 family)